MAVIRDGKERKYSSSNWDAAALLKIFKAHLDFFNFSARNAFSGSILSSDFPETTLSLLFVLWRDNRLLPAVLGRNLLACFVTRSALIAFPSFFSFSPPLLFELPLPRWLIEFPSSLLAVADPLPRPRFRDRDGRDGAFSSTFSLRQSFWDYEQESENGRRNMTQLGWI